MKTRLLIYLFLFSGLIINAQNNFINNSIIINDNFIYEDLFDYLSYDYFIKNDVTIHPLEITNINDTLIKITNNYNSYEGDGNRIEIFINKNLFITSSNYSYYSNYSKWSNSQNKVRFTVENIILVLNKNPFENNGISGYYTLKLKIEDNDVYYEAINCKFKEYNDEEIEKGIEWVKKENLKKKGIIDSNGIFISPEKYPEYKFGENELTKLIKEINLSKKEFFNPTKAFAVLTLVVDELGRVDINSFKFEEDLVSNETIERIKKFEKLWNNWSPAIYNCESVKCKIYLPIKFTN